ncbi:DUF2059 domain-containing protein [Nitratifractor sp.]
MFKKLLIAAPVALALFAGNPLLAEQPAAKAQHDGAKPKLKPLTPEAEKAAYALFDALKMKEGIRDALLRSLEIQIKRQPAMAPYEDIYKKFFLKYTKWEDMKKDLAKLYAQALTPEEMRKLTKFYSSDLGKKSLVVMPRLTQLSMLLAQQRIAKHAKELKEAVAKRAKELEAKAKSEGK